MNRNARGIGFYMLVGVMLILLAFSLRNSFSLRPDITYKEFQRRLEAGQVAAVDIQPNQEVPTGVLRITARDGSDASVNVLDVAEVQKLLEEYVIQTVSFFDTGNKSFYQGFMLGICAIFNGRYYVRSNRESGYDRLDIQLEPFSKDFPGFIFELKSDSSPDADLDALLKKAAVQIAEKQYEEELRSRGIKEIVKIGIAFAGKRVKVCQY